MTAFQIQVRGTLDGATLFVPPNPIPQPTEGGVRKLDAGVGVNVGIFDLADLFQVPGAGSGHQGPFLLSHLAVEPAAAVRALRFQLTVPGQAAAELLIPNQVSAAAVAMWPYGFFSKAYIPSGARISILSDSVGGAFGGVPVAGPHFVFFDLQPLYSDEEIAAAEKLTNLALAKQQAMSEVYTSFQAVAATLSTDLMICDFPSIDLGHDWMVSKMSIQLGAAAAAGESMVVTLARVDDVTGTVVTIASRTITNADAANTFIGIDLDAANLTGTNFLRRGDRLRLTRTYVAGGGPTPMTNTLVKVEVAPVRM